MSAPDPFALAKELAEPVAHGWLTESHAEGLLWTAVAGSRFDGTLHHDPHDVVKIALFVMHCHVDNAVARREEAAGRVRRRVRPLISTRARSSAIRAEAHDVNGEAGFPLSEDETDEIVKNEMFWAMQRDRQHGTRAHG